MSPIPVFALLFTSVLFAGCASSLATRLQERSTTVATLDPATRDKIERGVVEPGFTPEMVYLALGRPLSPATADITGTREGTWTYRSFHATDRDYVQAGVRHRRVYDPELRADTMVTEPVGGGMFRHLEDWTLWITFHEGRVTEVQRVPL